MQSGTVIVDINNSVNSKIIHTIRKWLKHECNRNNRGITPEYGEYSRYSLIQHEETDPHLKNRTQKRGKSGGNGGEVDIPLNFEKVKLIKDILKVTPY